MAGVQGTTQLAYNNVHSIFLTGRGQDASPTITDNGSTIFHRWRRKTKAFSVLVRVFGSFSGYLSLCGGRNSGFHLVNFTQARFNRIRILNRRFYFRFLRVCCFNCHCGNGTAGIKIRSGKLEIYVTSSSCSKVSFRLIRFVLGLHTRVDTFRVIGKANGLLHFYVMYDRPAAFYPWV